MAIYEEGAVDCETFEDYENLQRDEILGQPNMDRAREVLGHEPSDDEAATVFVENGGAKHFEQTHRRKDI